MASTGGSWKKGDRAEVWSESGNAWLSGTVSSIEGGLVYVDYAYPDGRTGTKGIPPGHPHIRRPGGSYGTSSAAAAPPAASSSTPVVAARPYGASPRPPTGSSTLPSSLPPAPAPTASSSSAPGPAGGGSSGSGGSMPRVGDSVEIWSNTENKWLRGIVDKIDGVMIYINYAYSDGRTATKGVPAGHKDIRGYGAGALNNSAATAAFSLESEMERDAVKQFRASTRQNQEFSTAGMPALSTGGHYDDLLVSPGSSTHLLKQLPQIFRRDPPNDAGRSPQKVGTFHGYQGNYGSKVFSANAVLSTLRLASDFWGRSRNVERLTIPRGGRLIIVGDTHGQLEDVLWMFFKYGPPTSSNQYLFNGDIVDRGGHALEILLLLFTMKRDVPDSVHILRGNHEDVQMSTNFGFQAELESKFPQNSEGSWLLRACAAEVFPVLPICAVVSDRKQVRSICVVHGGVPVNLPGQRGPVTIGADIEGIIRRVPTCVVKGNSYGEHCFYNLMWADPQVGAAPAKPGRGALFSESETASFCRVNQVSQLVRSHQPPDDLGFHGEGYCAIHSNQCVTIFSASNYCGTIGNKGAVLLCKDDSFGSRGMLPSDHWAPPWPELAEIMSLHYSKRISDYHQTVDNAESRARASVLGVPMSSPTKSFIGSPPGGLDAAPSSSSGGTLDTNGALQQVESMVPERICKKKRELFRAFSAVDTNKVMEVPKATWNYVMAQQLPEVPQVWPALAEKWHLGDPVRYVEFLHRFQIVTEVTRASTDSFSAFTRVRLRISDVSAKDLLEGLGGQSTTEVPADTFVEFLNRWGAELPEAQAVTLFNGIVEYLRRLPTAEDVLLGVALVSEHETASSTPGMNEVAKWLGNSLTSEGRPLAGFFIATDTDRDGFLSIQEFVQGIMMWQQGRPRQMSMPQLQQLAAHVDAQGQQNGRIGLMEFLRALGNRTFAMELASLMLGEVLMPVYFYKPTLLTHLSENALRFRSTVSWDTFYEALEEMNARMASLGEAPLKVDQMHQICDIACKGGNRVRYQDFLGSLKAVDTMQRMYAAGVGANVLGVAMGGGGSPPAAPDEPHRQTSTWGGGGDLVKGLLDPWKRRQQHAPANADPYPPPVQPGHPPAPPPRQRPAPWQDERLQDVRDDLRDGYNHLRGRLRRPD